MLNFTLLFGAAADLEGEEDEEVEEVEEVEEAEGRRKKPGLTDNL